MNVLGRLNRAVVKQFLPDRIEISIPYLERNSHNTVSKFAKEKLYELNKAIQFHNSLALNFSDVGINRTQLIFYYGQDAESIVMFRALHESCIERGGAYLSSSSHIQMDKDTPIILTELDEELCIIPPNKESHEVIANFLKTYLSAV